MLTINTNNRSVCSGLSRRDLLRVGGAGLFGTSVNQLLASETVRAATGVRAKSVMFLFLFGGPSQLESFDMKPSAASKIRGPLKPIASRNRTPKLRAPGALPKVSTDRGVVELTEPAGPE